MAQQFPTSAQVIYDTLATDTVFLDLLGSYNFRANNEVIKALSILSAGQDLPSVRNVTGVECVIQDAGNTVAQNYLTEEADLVTTWSMFLVAWEGSTGDDMQKAVNHALKRFVGSQAVQTVAASDGLGAMVQTKVFILSNKPIRPV